MLLSPGTQDRYIAETTTGAGSTVREGSIESDSLIATLWVDSVTSGDLSVHINTLTDIGKEITILTFPVVAAGTVNLLLKKAAISMQRFRIVASYSGICAYEIYVRAVTGAGEASARILGSENWRVSQVDVGIAPQILIPAALTDRNGVLVKNWSVTATIYLAETLVKASGAIGYPLAPRDALAMDIAAGAEVYAISDLDTADIRIAESGA